MVARPAYIQIAALIALFVGTVWAIVKVTQGERRIPVKYAPRQAGRRMVQAQRSFLPLKLAAAGVIPIIFAVSIVLFPGQIAQFYMTNIQGKQQANPSAQPDGWNWLSRVAQTIHDTGFHRTSLVASLIYAALVMGFHLFLYGGHFRRARFIGQPEKIRRSDSRLRAGTRDRALHQQSADAHHVRRRCVSGGGRVASMVGAAYSGTCRKVVAD